jgi:hypothetical protein
VIVPVFKTGGWQAILSSVGSTPTRFRQFVFSDLRASTMLSQTEVASRKSKSVMKS